MQVTRHCAVTYRIYPDKAQAGLIDRTIGCARLVYNLMLETRYRHVHRHCSGPLDHTRHEPVLEAYAGVFCRLALGADHSAGRIRCGPPLTDP